MLVDEMTSSSFVKKNNSYSHCPLKKRPVTVTFPTEEWKTEKPEIKEEAVEVMDEAQEPENLSTKPEDLMRAANKRPRSPSPVSPRATPVFSSSVKRSQSPRRSASPSGHTVTVQPPALTYQLNYPLYPTKANSPPSALMPIHPAAKRVRVEVLKHDASPVGPFMVSSASSGPIEPLPYHHHHHHHHHPHSALQTSLHSSLHASYGRTGPIHPTPLLPYPYYDVYPGYQHHVAAALAHSSPEHHQSVSPSPPHPGYHPVTASLQQQQQQQQQQRPGSFVQSSSRSSSSNNSSHFWPSPEHCGLSPTGSLGSVSSSLRSPPLVTPEDLSSPGSDSGRSSAGSTSVGSSSCHGLVNGKLDKSPGSPGSPRYQCSDCQKSYSTYSGLSKHQQFHCSAAEGQTKKSFSCKNCDKVYVTLGALKMHIRTHTLPCKCNLCGKAFSRPWLLQGHIRTHTGEKPFVCQHCNRAFADRSNLRAHLQTHSDVKKYSCSSCSKTFSRMSLLSKHQDGGCPGVAVPVPYGC